MRYSVIWPLPISPGSSLLSNYVDLIFFFSSWLHWVFIAACRLSLVAASGGVLFIAVLRLLIVVASLVVEHEL